VIFVLTWIIGVAHFPHIVAGTVDGMFLVFVGERPFASFAIDYFVPALLGNVIGGVLLVAAINHWQVGARRDRQDAADGIIVA
jgi:formate/nitrite transporter FocA (FNT family)